jgi:hypothetical protein
MCIFYSVMNTCDDAQVSTFVYYAQAVLLAWLPISGYCEPVNATRAAGASGGAAGASGGAAGAAFRTDPLPAALPTSRPFISFQEREGLAMYAQYSALFSAFNSLHFSSAIKFSVVHYGAIGM